MFLHKLNFPFTSQQKEIYNEVYQSQNDDKKFSLIAISIEINKKIEISNLLRLNRHKFVRYVCGRYILILL